MIIKYPDWCERLDEPKSIVNSNTEIHKIIHNVLDLSLPSHLNNLNEYNKDSNIAYSETIFNPNNDPLAHTIAIMDEKFKYVSWNQVDFRLFQLNEIIKTALYQWDESKNCFDESVNLIRELKLKNIVDQYSNLMNAIIQNNLEHLKQYPSQLY